MKNNKANNLEPLTDNEIININGGSEASESWTYSIFRFAKWVKNLAEATPVDLMSYRK